MQKRAIKRPSTQIKPAYHLRSIIYVSRTQSINCSPSPAVISPPEPGAQTRPGTRGSGAARCQLLPSPSALSISWSGCRYIQMLVTFTPVTQIYLLDAPCHHRAAGPPVSGSSLQDAALDVPTLARLILVQQGGQPECAPMHPQSNDVLNWQWYNNNNISEYSLQVLTRPLRCIRAHIRCTQLIPISNI